MVIDFHTHAFPDAVAPRAIASLEKTSGNKAGTEGTIKGLLKSMDESGVDLSVVLPVVTKPSQFQSITEFSENVNKKYKGRLVAFGGIHPDCGDYLDELEKIKAAGLPGVKIHPDYQGVMIDDIRYMNIIDYANQLGLIILTHAGHDMSFPGQQPHCTPKRIRRVIDSIKPEKLVLAHMGGWQQWDAAFDYLAGTDVYLDTAYTFGGICQDRLWEFLKRHDKQKILFATDSPWTDAAKGIAAVQALPVETSVKEDILAYNAMRLLGMK